MKLTPERIKEIEATMKRMKPRLEEAQKQIADLAAAAMDRAQLPTHIDFPDMTKEFEAARKRLMRDLTNAVKAAHASNEQPAEAKSSANNFSVAQIKKMTGLSDTTINNYAKLAGVVTPGRGKRNHRYSETDVIRILQCIVEKSDSPFIIERCSTELARLHQLESNCRNPK